MPPHSFGYIPDPPDERDLRYQGIHLGAKLLERVDLREKQSPVRDQGSLGSCTAFALSGMREYEHLKSTTGTVELSPLFLYYEERLLQRTVNEDSGSTIRNGMKVLMKVGCAPEVDVPYRVEDFAMPPSIRSVRDAVLFRVSSYHRVTSERSLKVALASGMVVPIGIEAYESFEQPQVAQDGMVPMYTDTEKVLGGHCTLVVGYDDSIKRWIVKNSWGEGWGDKGYFYLPYEYPIIDAWVGVL